MTESILASIETWKIVVFMALVLFFLWFDLHSHNDDKPITAKNSLLWTSLWVSLSLMFAAYIAFGLEHIDPAKRMESAQFFLAGYLLELSLAVDNLFVIMAIFTSFGVKDEYQHRVLYYGILGALVMRFIFIVAGTSLVEYFGVYALGVFGIFILWTAFKMWQHMGAENKEIEDFSQHWAVRMTRRFMPVHTRIEGHNFFVRVDENGVVHKDNGALKATPLFLCLIVVEISDVLFAFDSVPAIIAITTDPFIVYTSNIFAILGLRSMYFLLAAAKRYLRHLEKSVIAILVFIGIKMMLMVTGAVHLPAMVSLGVVGGLLALGIGASFLPEKNKTAE